VNSSLKSIVLESEAHHTEAILVYSSGLLSPFIKIARAYSCVVDNSNAAEISKTINPKYLSQRVYL
jgi:hypothetical protein